MLFLVGNKVIFKRKVTNQKGLIISNLIVKKTNDNNKKTNNKTEFNVNIS